MSRISQTVYDIGKGSLILINRQYAYRGERDRTGLTVIGEANDRLKMERRSAALLKELMNSIQGWQQIAVVSAWRSLEEQCEIWEQSLMENGKEFTAKYVALPGHSEHQTGLAVDLGLRKNEIDFIRPNFPHHGICQRFRERAAMYGFVERYPENKEHITEIGYEPWHFRYVGIPHAQIMERERLTLEEYITFLRNYTEGNQYYEFSGGGIHAAVSFLSEDAWTGRGLEIADNTAYSISGNNVDGFIITRWRKRYVC